MTNAPEPFYAMSLHKSGVFWFATMDEANTWVLQNDGQRLDAGQVDPDIRRQAREALA